VADGPDAALQAALRTALLADAGVAALVGARIYDEPPETTLYPYIRFGEAIVSAEDAMSETADLITFALEAHSRAIGRIEAKQIVAAIKIALHRAEPALAPVGFTIAYVEFQTARVDRAAVPGEGRGAIGRAVFRALLEPA